ncbi:MAG: YggT family protein, partial [Saezia sp.]
MPLSIKILEFLLGIIFNLFCMITIIRFYMQLAKISFANPIGQAVIKLTNWLVLPLQRVLPKIKRFDLPTFVAAYACSF